MCRRAARAATARRALLNEAVGGEVEGLPCALAVRRRLVGLVPAGAPHVRLELLGEPI